VNGQFEAAWQLHRFLTERGIPYVIIGGVAVQRWGEPRLTIDIDLAILLPPGGEERPLREIAAAFPPRLKDGVAFALEHRVLPIDVPGASPADLSLALPGFEEEAIVRAVDYDLGQGRAVRLCTADDLVVYKCVAGRAQDVLDVEGVVARQGHALDVAHVRRWVEEFARITDDREIVARFERAWANRPHRP
jgi:hypothetical protein